MKINISFTPYSKYKKLCGNVDFNWYFMYNKYKNVNGFICRIFGIYFNIRENNATEKLIKQFRDSKK